jgi:hypothetical protein
VGGHRKRLSSGVSERGNLWRPFPVSDPESAFDKDQI